MKNYKRKILTFVCLIIAIVALIPKYNIYEDGGTRTYTSLLYKIIVWNAIGEGEGKEGYKTGIEVHIFPRNFKNLDDYK